MSNISQIRKCYLCGATLQSDDPTKKGYVNKETLESASQNFLFCNECFEKERYHSTTQEPSTDPQFLTMLNDAKKRGALLVYIINLFSFEASFSKEINNIVKDMDTLVIASKFDLLPVGTDKDDIIEYVRHRFSASGLKISKDRIFVSNNFDDEITKEIISRILELKGNKDVFVVGSHLAGKTTFISSFLRNYKNLTDGQIETYKYPGTDLKVMEIPLNNDTSVFNTPGISISNSFLNDIEQSLMRTIYVEKALEGKKITLSPGQSFMIGGLCYVELLSGSKTKIKTFFADKIMIKKAKNESVENVFFKKISSHSIKPLIKRVNNPKDMDVYEIEVTEENRRDIGIQGLGWFSFEANNQKFRINVPKGVSVYSSRSKVLKELL